MQAITSSCLIYFNPPAPCGAGRRPRRCARSSGHFNPPAPCGAGPRPARSRRTGSAFQSTRPLRGGTEILFAGLDDVEFQSTRPLRGGTRRCKRGKGTKRYFNPPAPCGAGPPGNGRFGFKIHFNPPAPCGAGLRRRDFHNPQRLFQSTRPLRGGTRYRISAFHVIQISIHPPLAGRDLKDRADSEEAYDFNPPAPCGAGLQTYIDDKTEGEFQSTRPLRGGTPETGAPPPPTGISIHPPLAGRDADVLCREPVRLISIHPPLAGRDRPLLPARPRQNHFNPPVPCGAGLFQDLPPRHLEGFQSTRPLRGGTDHRRPGSHGGAFQSTRPLRGGTAILHKKTVQNIAYCTKSAFTLAVLSGFLALMRPFFCQTCTNFGANLPKNRCSLPVRTLIPSGPPPADSRH